MTTNFQHAEAVVRLVQATNFHSNGQLSTTCTTEQNVPLLLHTLYKKTVPTA